ncbi:MAG: SDR family oxidoreductase [Candidatus Aminicenantes bacterium]|nr:MAG: SDR family oxidoreductase [Candidatus Aminicenantes bacterium]
MIKSKRDRSKKWILITGANTGIGRACTEYLAKNGFKVYACARKQRDIDELSQIENVVSIRLDVTKEEDIKTALGIVRAGEEGLFGMINNSAIVVGGPLLDITEEEFAQQLEVNLIGLHRVTRAFAPLILEAKGRIIMMGSVNGVIATPFNGAYCASKFGLEGYSDALRRELLLYGVKVILIQPGLIETSIWDKLIKDLENYKKKEPIIEDLGEIYKKNLIKAIRENRSNFIAPGYVARVIYKVLTSSRPKARYMVTRRVRKMQLKIGRMFSDKIMDKLVLQWVFRDQKL